MILADEQPGFRKVTFTKNTQVNVAEHITANVDNGKRGLSVYLDLSEAFFVDFYILSKKLEIPGEKTM